MRKNKYETILLVTVLLMFVTLNVEASPHNTDKNNNKKTENSIAEEVTPEAMIRSFIDSGRYDEAEELLENLEGNEAAIESFYGLIAMKKHQPEKAIVHFKRSVELQSNLLNVWLFLAQAYYQTEQYKNSFEALGHGADAGKDLPAYYKLKARVETKLNKTDSAYKTISTARKLFPEKNDLLLEEALFFVTIGLYETALGSGKEYLKKNNKDKNGYLILGEAMLHANRPKEAAIFFERAIKLFENDADLYASLAYAYAIDNKAYIAARLFEQATFLGGNYAFIAAEHYGFVGQYRNAMKMNMLVTNEKERLSQRLALYLAQHRYDLVEITGNALKNLGSLNDDMLYKMAYASMKTRDLDQVKVYCAEITDKNYEEKANRLLEIVKQEMTNLH